MEMNAPLRHVVSRSIVIERGPDGDTYRSSQRQRLTVRYAQGFWGEALACVGAVALAGLLMARLGLLTSTGGFMLPGILAVMVCILRSFRARWTLVAESGDIVVRDDRSGRELHRVPLAMVRSVRDLDDGGVYLTLGGGVVLIAWGLTRRDAEAVRDALAEHVVQGSEIA
jgi:hypothetical protein